MEKALGLPSTALAEPDVHEIRELRNRLVGHPARRDRTARPSTAILSMMQIAGGQKLEGGIYYDDGFEIVSIDVPDFICRMREGLVPALLLIEQAMIDRETTLRTAESRKPLVDLLDYDFTYSLGKIASAARDIDRIPLAMHEMRSIQEHLQKAKAELEDRAFLTEGPLWALATIQGGTTLLARLAASSEALGEVSESEWDVVVKGIASAVDELRTLLGALDEQLNESPA